MAYVDPFDLSAHRAPIDEEPQESKKPAHAQKAVVRRVTLGPILHSRFVKLIVILALMFFAAFGGYAAMQWRLINNGGKLFSSVESIS